MRAMVAPRNLRPFFVLLVLALSVFMALVAARSEDPTTTTTPPQLAVVTTNSAGDAVTAEPGPVVRCRMCGATIAHKHDHMELPDTTKAVSGRYANELGTDVHTFVNPNRIEMELVAFKQAVGVEGEGFTSKATFFDGYSWKDLRCGGCNRHVGWKFHHDDFQGCVHKTIMETVSAKAQENMKAATAEEHAKKRELVHKELEGQCITATAGWWSYQICYSKEVRQYHEEPDGTRPSDWSMGVHVPDDKTVEKMQPTRMNSASSEIVQYFAGGQRCDENGEQRSSKVIYTCCKTRPAEPSIENIEEPSLCSYVITVCVPSLCSKAPQPDTPYNSKEINDKCELEFAAKHADPEVAASFAALRWSTVISDDSSELDWARNLQFKT